MKRKLALLLVLLVTVTTLFVGCKEEKKQFVVGFDQNFPPMGFVGTDGEYTGFDLEVAAEVAKRLDMEFVAQPIEWASKDMELESGTIDCIWNGFTMSEERLKQYAWTDPYMDNKQVFVVKADSGIQTKEDLAGKVVEVQEESSAQTLLESDDFKALKESFKDSKLSSVPDYNTSFMNLESGAIDAIAMDSVVANYQIEQRNGGFVILDEALATEEYGVGFYKENTELRDQVQKTLEEMVEDGTLAKIATKWFGSDITTFGKEK